MGRPLLLCALMTLAWLHSPVVKAQDIDIALFRTYDGTYNNLMHPEWGSAGENLRRMVPARYVDGVAMPLGEELPNPREVSNVLVAQDEQFLADPMNLSDYFWVWGQFLDHDFGLTPDGEEPMLIPVPQGDPWFDPFGEGRAVIPALRNLFDTTTGSDPDNPREHPNIITAFIDGSGVYGSDEEKANWLRTFQGGKLKVSSGNNLPYNTLTGEFSAPIDITAPHMDNPVGLTQKLFVAGDPRANENPALASMHLLFVREHNRLCDELAQQHPEWDDEDLYQHARKMVGGMIASITYNEWLPTAGVNLPPYQGYDQEDHPQVFNGFTGAAFRLGHTFLNSQLLRLRNDGRRSATGHVSLREAFFDPFKLVEGQGLEPFLRGMAVQTQQQMDARIVDDVRNFLFGAPGAGGLDLAAINISRGRERGLGSYEDYRRALGLGAIRIFQNISNDPLLNRALEDVYEDTKNIDPWVGMLSEKRLEGSLFGETLTAFLTRQFRDLRDGDRFFFENDPLLSSKEKAFIRKTTLHDIIMRNSEVNLIQDNVFRATPFDEICDNMTIGIDGFVYTMDHQPIAHVDVVLNMENSPQSWTTDEDGWFGFEGVPACDSKSLSADKLSDDYTNGVTTYDLVLIQRHILGINPFRNPYQYFAADVNESGTISVTDMIALRKLILRVEEDLPAGKAWTFIPASFEFNEFQNPLDQRVSNTMEFDLTNQDMSQEYIGIKLGDVNNTVSLDDEDLRSKENPLELSLENAALAEGEVRTVAVQAKLSEDLAGFQFALAADNRVLEILEVSNGPDGLLHSEQLNLEKNLNQLMVSWTGEKVNFEAGKNKLFEISVRARRPLQLQDALYLDQRLMQAEAYDEDLSIRGVKIVSPAGSSAFTVWQNQPNPFNDATIIPFELNEPAQIILEVFDLSGRVLLERSGQFGVGAHQFELRKDQLPGSGLMYYRVSNGLQSRSFKMNVLN